WVPAFAGTSGATSLDAVVRNNLDPSGEPVDADFVADAESRQRDCAAARHAGCKEADRLPGRPLIAALSQERVERDVVRNADDTAGRAGANDALRRVDFGHDLQAVANGSVAVGLEHRGGLDGERFEPRPRGAAR